MTQPISRAAWEAAMTIDTSIQGYFEEMGLTRLEGHSRIIETIAAIIQRTVNATAPMAVGPDGEAPSLREEIAKTIRGYPQQEDQATNAALALATLSEMFMESMYFASGGNYGVMRERTLQLLDMCMKQMKEAGSKTGGKNHKRRERQDA